jgi:hypothetical protein
MKKHSSKRLSLSPETVRVLGETKLERVAGGGLIYSQVKDEWALCFVSQYCTIAFQPIH